MKWTTSLSGGSSAYVSIKENQQQLGHIIQMLSKFRKVPYKKGCLFESFPGLNKDYAFYNYFRNILEIIFFYNFLD